MNWRRGWPDPLVRQSSSPSTQAERRYGLHPEKAKLFDRNITYEEIAGQALLFASAASSHLQAAPSPNVSTAVTPQTIMGWRMGGSAHQNHIWK